MKRRSTLFLYWWLMGLVGCSGATQIKQGPAIESQDVWIPSRGVEIPATITFPKEHDGKLPLVLLIHGHGGTRHEAGGFTRIADGLAKSGVSSIRMDFPGCGDSRESFAKNNLTNMLEDIEAAERYANSVLTVDQDRLALVGFSMGGRLAVLHAKDNSRFDVMAMWAPAVVDGATDMVKFLGGRPEYDRLRAQAKKEGFAPFTTFWGQDQKLGYQWFTDLEKSRPMSAIGEFRGALFVLYGDLDDVIVPAVSEAAVAGATQARTKRSYVVKGADHGLGLFNDDHNSSRQAVDQTVKFLLSEL